MRAACRSPVFVVTKIMRGWARIRSHSSAALMTTMDFGVPARRAKSAIARSISGGNLTGVGEPLATL